MKEERQNLLDEFRQQETSLRAQLEKKTQVLDRARSEALENLAEAQAELAKLEVARQQSEAIENQVLGFYGRLQRTISAGNWEDAGTILQQAKAFLNQDSVIASNAITERRATDLFVLNTIETYIENEQSEAEDLESISKQLEILSRVRLNDSRASAAISENDLLSANNYYSDSMNAMPELRTAHQALVQNSLDQLEGQLEQEFNARLETVEELTGEAQTFIEEGRYEQALITFDEALQTLPEFEKSNETLTAGLLNIGFSVAEAVVLNQNSGLFTPVVERAKIDSAATLELALEQINRAVTIRENELLAELEESNDELQLLREVYEERLSNVEAEITENYETQIESSTTQLALYESQLEDLTAKEAELTNRNAELTNEINRLENFERLLNRVSTAYSSYQSSEDTVLGIEESNVGSSAIFAAKQELESFLGSTDLRGIFPGFADRIRKYDTWFEEAGRELGLNEALEIVTVYLSQATPEQQQRYLDSELSGARADNDTALEQFLVEFAAETR